VLPITGPGWQGMRASRNRNWGNPSLVAFIDRLADSAKKVGWNGTSTRSGTAARTAVG
jgi:penicillin-insensitive murein DD-endopeptidase